MADLPTVVKIENADLTTQQITGTGVFDILMVAFKAHLKEEYNSNRITGEQYTKAYIALVEAAMSNAVQFLLGRDQSYWSAISTSEQAKINKFTIDELLPLQKKLLQEQVEVQRAQTLDVRTDGLTVVGSVGKQKDLYNQQITSYKRDAEMKGIKVFVDAWVTMKTIDEGLAPPTAFANTNLDAILATMKTNLAL